MKPLFVPYHELAAQKRNRPPTYESEIEPAIFRRTDKGMWFDMDHPSWEAAIEKYQTGKPATTGETTIEVHNQPRAVVPKGCGCGRR